MAALWEDRAMEGTTVRRASASDLDALLSLYRELAGGKASAAPAERDAAEPVLERILAQDARELAVAVAGGQVIGTADMVIVPNLTHRAEPWAIVENVIVAASHRRTGAGRALMAHLIEIARACGCCKVELISGRHRSQAHAFYRSMGFQAVAEGFKLYFDEQS